MKTLSQFFSRLFHRPSPEEKALIARLRYLSTLPPPNPPILMRAKIDLNCITAAKIDASAITAEPYRKDNAK